MDNLNKLVSGANVTGDFSEDIDETVMGATDVNGVVVLKSNAEKGRLKFAFCVADVSNGDLLQYISADNSANVQTCP